MRVNLSGGSNVLRAPAASTQRVLNLYPEPIRNDAGEPAAFAHYLTPGLKQVYQATGEGRAAYQTTQGDAIFVIGSEVIWLLGPGSVRIIGSLPSLSGPVRMSDNGTTLFIVDGSPSGGWYCSMPVLAQGTTYGKLYKISDPAFYGSSTISILDTFFIFSNPGTTNWYTSPAQFADESLTPFDPLYVASDATSLGTIIGCAVLGQYIWIFSRFQVEFWYDSGAADFPFQRVQGVTVEAGCLSPFTICPVPTCAAATNGAIIWLGRDRSGLARVYMGQQTIASPISTFSVENALQSIGALEDAVASVYQQDGHIFYVLTIPGSSSSWVYDVSTGLWHERCSLDDEGNEVQSRAKFWCQAYGMVLCCDRDNGAIYQADLDIFTEAGNPIKRQRVFPHFVTDGSRGIHRKFEIDMQAGGGQSILVDWSDDRGNSFCTPQTLELGNAGNTWPTIWRLGMARDRVYRVTWSDPGETALMGAFIEIDPVRA